jgi:hypothetical protein
VLGRVTLTCGLQEIGHAEVLCFQELSKVMDLADNFKAYREEVNARVAASATEPLLPYIGTCALIPKVCSFSAVSLAAP